jgi:hypothetical protein
MTYTTVADVEKVFNQLFEGNFVDRVDERSMTDSHGQPFKMFYIHFTEDVSIEMDNFNRKMAEDGVVQVMTGRGKWFWKVYLNKSVKASKPVRTGPRIMTEDDEKLFLQWKETRNRAAAAPSNDEVGTIAEEMAKDEKRYLQWNENRNRTAFTEEELDTLDEAVNQETFTEEELDELDSEHAAAETHAEQEELMAIADEMAKE